MLNLIRSDFYKAFHMKSLRVMCIVAAALMFLMEGPLAGDDMLRVRSFNDIVDLSSSTYPLLFFSLFMSFFVSADFKNGYIKNIAGSLADRSMMIISKLVIAFAVYWIFFLDVFITTILSDLIFHKISFEGVVFSDVITRILVVFFVSYAIGAVIILFAYGAKSGGLSTTMAVMISGGMIVETIFLFCMLLSIGGFISADFDIYPYFLTPYINYYGEYSTGNACIAAACYLIGATIFTILHVKKKDI